MSDSAHSHAEPDELPEIGAGYNAVAEGCVRWAAAVLGVLVLAGLGSCALLNSVQIRHSIPENLPYDRVLVFVAQPGLLEGCDFIAYRLTDASADRIRRNDVVDQLHFPDRRPGEHANYSRFTRTPAAFQDKGAVMLEGQRVELVALGASEGCDEGTAGLPRAEQLLREPGNLYAVGNGGEALSILSPRRRIALFLNFG